MSEAEDEGRFASVTSGKQEKQRAGRAGRAGRIACVWLAV
jgi:hypothetical protein